MQVIRFGIRTRDQHLNLNTRTRYPMAETRDLGMCTAANHPVSGPPLLFILTANRQPLSPVMGRAAIAMAAVRGRGVR